MNITIYIPEFLTNGYFWSGVGAATLFWAIILLFFTTGISKSLSNLF